MIAEKDATVSEKRAREVTRLKFRFIVATSLNY
jgi:hypothetical protein